MYQASLPLAFNHVCQMKFVFVHPHFKLDNVDVLASVCITAFALHCKS